MEIATGRTIVYKLIKFVSPVCIRQELDRFGQHEERASHAGATLPSFTNFWVWDLWRSHGSRAKKFLVGGSKLNSLWLGGWHEREMGVVALLIQELAGGKNVFLLTYVSIPHGVIPVNNLFHFLFCIFRFMFNFFIFAALHHLPFPKLFPFDG